MKTTLLTRSGSSSADPPTSPWRSERAAATTCSTISPADMLRVRPACPVAQNGQFMPQPAWLEMQIVVRFGYRISTVSTIAPSKSRHSVLTVSPASACCVRTWVSRRGSSAPTSSSRPALGRSVIWAGSSTSRSK